MNDLKDIIKEELYEITMSCDKEETIRYLKDLIEFTKLHPTTKNKQNKRYPERCVATREAAEEILKSLE